MATKKVKAGRVQWLELATPRSHDGTPGVDFTVHTETKRGTPLEVTMTMDAWEIGQLVKHAKVAIQKQREGLDWLEGQLLNAR